MSASASALACEDQRSKWYQAISGAEHIEPHARHVHGHACGATYVRLMRIGALGPVHAGRDNYRRRGVGTGRGFGFGFGVKRSEMGSLMLLYPVFLGSKVEQEEH